MNGKFTVAIKRGEDLAEVLQRDIDRQIMRLFTEKLVEAAENQEQYEVKKIGFPSRICKKGRCR